MLRFESPFLTGAALIGALAVYLVLVLGPLEGPLSTGDDDHDETT